MGAGTPLQLGPHQIDFYTSPWVSGMRALSIHGPVSSNRFFTAPSEWEVVVLDMMQELAHKAIDAEANSIVNFEINIELVPMGYHLQIVGCAARLESINWGGR
jgi:hypothetical protein